jgi:hypothetical protein
MIRRHAVLALVAGFACSALSVAVAQTHTYVGAFNDVWSNPFNWTPQNVPQSAGDHPLIPFGAAVRLNQFATLGGLTTDPFGLLSIDSGQALFSAAPTWQNSGRIVVNEAAGPSGTYIRFDSSTVLQSVGRLSLNANPSDYNSAYLTTNGTTPVNGPGHTIDGVGRILGSWANQGTIVANVSGYSLDLNCSIANAGMIRATNNAYTTLRGNITQEPFGQIVADNGATYLYSQTYTGGTMSAINGGTTNVVSGNTPSLYDVSTAGPVNIPTGSALILGTVGGSHNGTITVNDSAGPNGTYVRFDQSGTLSGNCTIQLNADPGDYNSSYLNANGTTIELPSTYTVQGRGRMFGSWINRGVIQTTGSGNSLDLNAAFVNHNLIQATDQAYLTLRGNFAQSASGSIVGDNADIYFYNNSYSGGTATATNGGRLYVTTGSTPTFSGMQTSGPIVIPTGSALVFATTGEALNSTITVNESTGPNGTYVRFDQTGTLGGDGVLQLNAQTSDLNTAYANANGTTITVPSTWTVQGVGRFIGSWVNDSLFETTGAGNSFDFSSLFTNNGTVRASDGAYLTPRAGLTQGASGTFVAQNNSIIYLYNTSYSGGELKATTGSQVYVVDGNVPTLSNLKVSGPLNIPSGSGLVFASTGQAHDGTLTVNSSGGPNGTYARWDQSGTLAGNQTIVLNGQTSDLNTAYLNANGTTITVPPSTTIGGTGRFFGSWINNSTIATGPNGGLNFASPFTNNASVKADDNSYLVLNNAITQGPFGLFAATNNSVIYLYSSSYTGGQFSADDTSQIYVVDGNVPTLSSPVILGKMNIPGGTATVVNGGSFVQLGTTHVNSSESPNSTFVRFDGNTTVGGNARFVLHPYASDWSTTYLNSNGGFTTFAPDATLEGTGRLFGFFSLLGDIRPQYNADPIGYLYAYASLNLGFSSNYRVDLRADGVSDYLFVAGSTINLAGTLHINVLPGYSPAPGDEFIVAYSAGRAGTFDNIIGPALPNNRRWEVQYTSTQAILYVGCGGDFNRDGFIDFSDFDEFVVAFEAGEARSDFNEDGFLDFTDFDDFVAAFEQGC